MKITSLVENRAGCDAVAAEHGLSLYIETKNHRILFDMGQSELFYENAVSLGIDLKSVDIAILSHGHYDHGGGLKKFFEINDSAPVYIQRDAFLPHYNGEDKYIGLDTALMENERIIYTDCEYKIDDELSLVSCNDMQRKYPICESGLLEKVGDRFVADDFRHEQFLLISENGKRVLISGCSHKGILDIAHWFEPDALVGGFHYSKMMLDGYLSGAAKELAGYATEFYTCHCTGFEQYEFMKQYMKRLHYLACGQSITI